MSYSEDNQYNGIEWNEKDKAIFDEIKECIRKNDVGESLKNINHSVNAYLNKALLKVQGLQSGEYQTSEKQKEALKEIFQNSLKASVVSKELRKFYHL